MGMYPLTPGLLASMMMRRNHAVFMPRIGEGDVINLMVIGQPEDRIPKAIDQALDLYDQAERGTLGDAQVLEEVVGTGFYSPEREEGYVATIDQFPGMLALAMDRIAARGR
jgi:hypothetical protein